MSIKSEKRDIKARKRWNAIVNILAYVFSLDLLLLLYAGIRLNARLFVAGFFALFIILPPLVWMAPGRMKGWGKDYIPWWWGGL